MPFQSGEWFAPGGGSAPRRSEGGGALADGAVRALAAPRMADEAALRAIRALDEAARRAASEPAGGTLSAHQPVLQLHVVLRARADELVHHAGSDIERAAVRLACTIYLSLVLRRSSHPDLSASANSRAAAMTVAQMGESLSSESGSELESICKRSERYVELASRSSSLVTSHALRHLREMISAAPPPSADYNEHIVGAWIAWRSSRLSDEQAEGEHVAHAGHTWRDGSSGSGRRWGGITSGGLGCVLTFGYSPHVTRLLAAAAATEHFTVLIAEGQLDGAGHLTAAELEGLAPVVMIEPQAVSRCLHRVQVVLCAAHAVTGDGGAVADIGTLTYAMAAEAHHVPFCVAVPHYAFHRGGTPEEEILPPPFSLTRESSTGSKDTFSRSLLKPRLTRDVTPPKLVTWYFTDIGIMPPAGVVDWQLTYLSGRHE